MKKKIWIINHYATTMFDDRGGRHYWFAKYLLSSGYEPIIICANTYHNSEKTIEIPKGKYGIKETDNIPFVFVKTITARGNGLKRVLNMFMFYRNLLKVSRKIIKQYGKPDIIHASSQHPFAMYAGIKISKRYNIPCICEIRDLWPEVIFTIRKTLEKKIIGKLMLKGEYWIYKKADALIFLKEGEINYIKDRCWDKESDGHIDLNKVYYINNGVNLEEFELQKKAMKLDDEDLLSKDFKIIYTGAIRPVNDVEKLVNTAYYLRTHNDLKFLIYGDGFLSDNLKKKAESMNLNNIVFKGIVNKQYVPYILSKSSVNILNYSQNQYNWTRGNSSNKLFEYMASGKPVMSTVKMGYSIIKKHDCGIEIEDASPKQIADEILKLKNASQEEYERMCLNAINGAKEYDFRNLTRKLIEVIEGL